MTSDEAACKAGYVLLTPDSFHRTEQNLISWECPQCGCVVVRHAWQKHELFHGRDVEERHWIHATGAISR